MTEENTEENTEYPHDYSTQNAVNDLDVASEQITLNLDQETHDSLIEIYVNNHFTKESIGTFNDYLAEGETHIEALSRGVINEMVIIALTEQQAVEEFVETLKENNTKE